MKFCIHLLLILSLSPALAQYTKYSSEDKKALKYYEEARVFLKRAQFPEAIEPLNAAIKRDPKFIEVWLALGSAYSRMGADSLTLYHFNKAIEINPDYPKSKYAYFSVGEIYLKKAQYEKANEYLTHYLRVDASDAQKNAEARKLIESCRFSIDAVKNPFNYQIQVLPDHANHFKLQYFPILSVDQKTLYFTRREGLLDQNDEDIFLSKLQEDGIWSIPESISGNINTEYNEGAASLSADGRTLVFTACEGERGYRNCDLYVCNKEGDQWSKPANMGRAINTDSWEAQGVLSADGRAIYFSSRRPGGFGREDLYVSKMDNKGKWQEAVNLGRRVNSSGSEFAPFMHLNGESLYFSSDGHAGLGGLDLYMSEQKDSIWSEPVNLGYPLNDEHDQVSLYISTDGKSGVYSKEKNLKGDYESKIYSFNLPDSFQVTNKSSYLTGIVLDADTDKPLGSTIKIYQLNNDKYFSELTSDKINGNFTIVLTEGNKYGVYATCPGYVFKDFSFTFEELSSFDKKLLEIRLQPVKVGVKTVLGNIFFDFDEFSLKRESMSELKVVFYFLRNNPKVKVEIGGHTDGKGSEVYNKQLSAKRAKTVYDFLIFKGISPNQLSYAGYGFTKPVTNSSDLESQALNRRIEFVITQID